MLRAPGPDGAALYVSPSSSRVLGYPPEVVADGGPSELVHPDDRAGVRALLQTLGPGDGIVLHTHRVRRADGAFIWVEGAFQVAERGGEPTVVVALRDVTERQQRAQDLAAAKEVAERAQRSAEQASEAKSDFLAAMSHEIRTPLNSIIGFTDLMLDAGDLPEQAQRQADLIRASGAALLTVVNDVLDFSKVEAGAVELEAIPFSPIALARHCAAILRGYAGTKALDIEVEIGERLPDWLVGDEARLRQVLLNLLNNAVKFTPRGRVTLRLSYLDGGADGETVPLRGRRHRHRHLGDEAAPPLRALLPGRQFRGAPLRRLGPRPRHLQEDRRAHGRHHRGHEPRGAGLDLLVRRDPAGGRGAGRAGAPASGPGRGAGRTDPARRGHRHQPAPRRGPPRRRGPQRRCRGRRGPRRGGRRRYGL